MREEGRDEIAKHDEGKSEIEEEEHQQRNVGVLEDLKENESAANANQNKLEDVENEPRPNQSQVAQTLSLSNSQ